MSILEHVKDKIAEWAYRRLVARIARRFGTAPMFHSEHHSAYANSLLPKGNARICRWAWPVGTREDLRAAVLNALEPCGWRGEEMRTIPRDVPTTFQVFETLEGRICLVMYAVRRQAPPNVPVKLED